MPIPDLSQIDFKICIPLGIVILLSIMVALGRPKETIWIEHCPHCHAELGPKSKGERPGKCKKCGRDLYYTKPHGS